MAHYLIQPTLCAVLHFSELCQPFPAADAACMDGLACEAFFLARYGGVNAQELLATVCGLHHEGAAYRLTVNGHMLVPRQQNIEVQLLTQPVGYVFMGGGQYAASGQIPLKAAVIDAQRHVHLILQRLQCRTGSGNGIVDGDAGQVLRPLPDVHIVGDNAHDADPQPVFQRVDAGGKAHSRAVPADVFTDAAGMEGIEIAVQIRHAVVEIVVAQRYIVIAAAVHHLGKPAGVPQRVVTVSAQRGALQNIAAVDDQRIAVLTELAGAFEQADVPLLTAAIVGGVDITVQVGGKIDRKVFRLHSFTPVPA